MVICLLPLNVAYGQFVHPPCHHLHFENLQTLQMLQTTQSNLTKALPALDGIRGIASFIVLIFHGLLPYGPALNYGFGADGNYGVHQLPIFRLMYHGPTMVCMFYIISGYLLSLKSLRLIRQAAWAPAFHSLSSSSFRRPIRLFLPAVVSTFITMLLHWFGFFETAAIRGQEIGGVRPTEFELPVPHLETFGAQLGHWFTESLHMMNAFAWERRYNPYNPHLWTLASELRASYVLFVTILVLARLKFGVRLSVACFMALVSAYYQKWEIANSLGGMILAEVELSYGTGNETSRKPSHQWNKVQKWKRQQHFLIVFVMGLYVASYPKLKGPDTPGFHTLSRLTPYGFDPANWWQSLGALIIVLSVNNSPDVQWLFNTRLAQYLGRLSLSIYIVHGPVMHSLGLVVITSSWKYTGKDTPLQKAVNFLACATIVIPAIFLVAELFWRLVDKPCGKFTRWVERKLVSVVAIAEIKEQ